MNINEIPKKFMDSAAVGHDAHSFLVIFVTGNESHGFVLAPQGAKAFYENLGRHIKEYEATSGPIDTAGLDLGTLSPIQKGA